MNGRNHVCARSDETGSGTRTVLWRQRCKPFRVKVRAHHPAHVRHFGKSNSQRAEVLPSKLLESWSGKGGSSGQPPVRESALQNTHVFYCLQCRGLRGSELPRVWYLQALRLQRCQIDCTFRNSLRPTQLSSLLSPKVIGCRSPSLHRGLRSFPQALPPTWRHPKVSSQVQTALLHLVSANTRERNGHMDNERCQARVLCADQSVHVLVSLVGPGGDKDDGDSRPLPPWL